MSALVPREMCNPSSALLAAFHRSDERGRRSVLEFALTMAEDWPAASPIAAPSTPLELLITDVADLSAKLASAPFLHGTEQVEFLLDCSCLADDFARNLDVLVGTPS